MDRLSIQTARDFFSRLPPALQITTLSPDYVIADAARDPQLEPVFIGGESAGGVWLHGVHRCRIPGSDLYDFQSPYGYGGPVTSITVPETLARFWSAYTVWCAAQGILVEFVRFHPLAPVEPVYGGRIFADRDCVFVPLQSEDIRAGYETRCRTAVRKAEKNGVTITEMPREAIHERFPAFYRDGMRMIGAAAFYLFDDAYFVALSRIASLKLLVAEHEGRWCAASLFFTGPDVWEYHLSSATPEGRRLCAANLLIDHAAHAARSAGAGKLFLGGGTDRDPANPLLHFKASFASARAPFRIGSTAHRQDEYETLRSCFPDGPTKSRILFYRE